MEWREESESETEQVIGKVVASDSLTRSLRDDRRIVFGGVAAGCQADVSRAEEARINPLTTRITSRAHAPPLQFCVHRQIQFKFIQMALIQFRLLLNERNDLMLGFF